MVKIVVTWIQAQSGWKREDPTVGVEEGGSFGLGGILDGGGWGPRNEELSSLFSKDRPV